MLLSRYPLLKQNFVIFTKLQNEPKQTIENIHILYEDGKQKTKRLISNLLFSRYKEENLAIKNRHFVELDPGISSSNPHGGAQNNGNHVFLLLK